ncbi:MAG: NAD(P)/FAD-dependent oxidoreductase [Acidimicrobiales bacterium]
MPRPPPTTDCWDAVVIGGGPAGLAAATWLGRYRRRTLVFDHGEYRNRSVELSHGYLTMDPSSPSELLEAARRGVDRYAAVERREAEVSGIRGEIGRFTVELVDGSSVEAMRIVLATGVRDVKPEIDDFDEHYGASVFHCPSCDGLEAEGHDVVALGWSEEVAGFALELLDWAASVTVITDGHRFEGDAERREALTRNGIRLVEDDARAFIGARGDLRAVRLSGGESLPCSLAFFSVDHRPRSPLADALGCAYTDDGCLLVDETGETTVPGVYAAGDITPGYQLIQVATAKGTTSGVGCALSLRREPPLPGAPERAPVVEEELGADAADEP